MVEAIVELAKSTKSSLDVCVENYLSLAKLLYELIQKIQEICRDSQAREILARHGLCS